MGIVLIVALLATSCFFEKQHSDIDPFYTARNFGQFPVIPLIKPVKILCDDQTKKWNVDIPSFFVKRVGNRDLYNSEVGVEMPYIYGKLLPIKRYVEDYKEGDHIYMFKDGKVTWSPEILELGKDCMLISSFDTLSKSFIEPERWFVINVADSTTEAFFSKAAYTHYLKEQGISGKMYDINKYHQQFLETGVLPWFPDSVKVKLRK